MKNQTFYTQTGQERDTTIFEGIIIVHPNNETLSRSVVKRVVNSFQFGGSKELKKYGNSHIVIDRINGELKPYSAMWGANYYGK